MIIRLTSKVSQYLILTSGGPQNFIRLEKCFEYLTSRGRSSNNSFCEILTCEKKVPQRQRHTKCTRLMTHNSQSVVTFRTIRMKIEDNKTNRHCTIGMTTVTYVTC